MYDLPSPTVPAPNARRLSLVRNLYNENIIAAGDSLRLLARETQIPIASLVTHLTLALSIYLKTHRLLFLFSLI